MSVLNLFALNKQQNTPETGQQATSVGSQQNGQGQKPSYEDWYKTVPADRNDTSNYNLRRAYELAPFEEIEKWRTARPEQLDDEAYHLKSMYFDPKTGIGEFMKSKNHPTLQGELDFYYGNSPESVEFRNKYDLDASGDYYRYIPKKMQQKSPVGMPSQTMVQQQQRQTVPAYSGGSNNAQAALDYLASAYTTPKREDEIRKASVMNQRIAAVADALRHIGNIYNTTQYAPSQQFNNPVQEEYARYLQGKSVRDAANQRYLTYMQQKAAQDAQMDRFEKEQEYKNNLLQHYREQEERLREKDAATRENQEAKRDLDREKFEADKAFKDGKLSVAQARHCRI